MRYARSCCRITKVGDKLEITGVYVDKNEKHTVIVPVSEYVKYLAGALIQEAFPNLSANDREFLISGLSPDFFDLKINEEE